MDIKGYKSLAILHEDEEIVVFQAERIDDRLKSIIKFLKSPRPRVAKKAALRREFQINHELHLQHVVFCREIVDQPDSHFLIFEDVGGISLEKWLKGKSLSLKQFFPIALQIVDCLEELHVNHVIHKDVKPDNILIIPDTLEIKLFDLSAAHQVALETQELIPINQMEGSLPYMAPEQTGRMNRPIDYRSDYYALGVTFYELLTGNVPFISDDPLEYVHFHLAIEPKPITAVNPNVPVMLSKLVAKLMSKDAEARYQSSIGLKSDLQRCFEEWKQNKEIPEFPLGEKEVFDHLTLSTKIYGREVEIGKILASFDRVQTGKRESLMIAGYSGVGKTTLVNEVQKPLAASKGYFISGKFDQLLRSTPYTAFTQAFTALVQYWLAEPESKLRAHREKLQNALGNAGQVIIDIFPQIELIIGKQPQIELTGPSQDLFLLNFQKFIGCIATKEEPLVIFIDDLQWIDQASLRLLDIILSSEEVESLLLIGAYRDNEVDDSHPLFKQLKKSELNIQNIKLLPLDKSNNLKFLSDSLNLNSEQVLPLSQAVYDKTEGNPFFIKEFVKEIYHQKLLTFSYPQSQWIWNLDKIIHLPGSDNVIDLMLSKIYQLPTQTQKLLQAGACIGVNFDIATLALIEQKDENQIIEELSPATKSGLIQGLAFEITYKFIHDRIHQAAYQTLSRERKKSHHLFIGRLLLSKIDNLAQSDRIFEVLDHFKHCPEWITALDEKKQLAELTLAAGKKAKESKAYQAGIDYLQMGIDLTINFDWNTSYNLLWNLYIELIECLYMTGSFQKALSLIDFLLEKSKTNYDKAAIYYFKMRINFLLGDPKSSLENFSRSMKLFDIDIPIKPTKLDLFIEYCKFRWNYGYRNPAKKIRDLKIVESKKLETIMITVFW